MHPKQICKDVESMGAKLVLDGNDLFIENPEKVYPEIEEFIKGYKTRILKYLNGSYSDKEHNVRQTIDKIIVFMRGIEQDNNSKIKNWINHDDESLTKILELLVLLSKNGWVTNEPISNYEDEKTDKLSKQIYDSAMNYFKGAS
ncbi:hypothetical protein ABFV99_14625 [Cytobacillus horneckiae]|uniref:hypothetical protein n=1 Tax=Cytobacillus horneckiae TaxID=549687 RepID=UPI0034D01D3C